MVFLKIDKINNNANDYICSFKGFLSRLLELYYLLWQCVVLQMQVTIDPRLKESMHITKRVCTFRGSEVCRFVCRTIIIEKNGRILDELWCSLNGSFQRPHKTTANHVHSNKTTEALIVGKL